MKILTHISILILLLFAVTQSSFAQNSKVHGIEIEIGTAQGINANGDSLFSYKAHIHLTDTLDILKVYIKVGTSYLGNDMYDNNYAFYLSNGETNPANIVRNNEVITVDLGAIVPGFFFWEIISEDLNNVQYTPYRKQK